MPTITVDIKAVGGAQFQRSFEQASQVMGRTFPQAARVAEAQVSSMTKALELQSQVLARVKSQAVGAFAAYLGAGALVQATRSIVQSSNALVGWQNSLTAATGSAKGASDAMAFVRAEADRLGLSLETSAKQFASLSNSARGTALEGGGVQKVFTSVAQAARVMNLSNEQVQGAFVALSQMMGKQQIMAEELRGQLAERIPGAVKIMADALGVGVGELSKMLESGALSGEKATEAISKFADELNRIYSVQATAAANSPAAEFERLGNALFDLQTAIGQSGVMENLAAGARTATEAIRDVVDSGALDKIASGLSVVGQAATVAFGGKVLQSMGAYVTAQLASVKASQNSALAAKSEALAQAELVARRAESLRITVAETSARVADLQSARSIATSKKLQSVLDKEITLALREQRNAQSALNVAVAEGVAARQALNAANKQAAVNAGMLSTAMTGLGKAAGSAFALIGGWPTVILGTAYAMYQLYDAFQNGSVKTQEVTKGLDGMIERLNKAYDSAILAKEGVSSSFIEMASPIADAYREIEELTKKQDAYAKAAHEVNVVSAETHDIMLSNLNMSQGYAREIEILSDKLSESLVPLAKQVAIAPTMVKAYEDQARNIYIMKGRLDEYNAAVLKTIPEMARSVVASKDMQKSFDDAARVVKAAGGDVETLRAQVAELASKGGANVKDFAAAATIAFGETGAQAVAAVQKIMTAFGRLRKAEVPVTTVTEDPAAIAKEASAAYDELTKKVSESNTALRTAGLEGVALIKEQARIMREDAESRYVNADAAKALADQWEASQIAIYRQTEAVKISQKSTQDLERSQARWADMIGRVASGLSDAQKVEEKYQNTMRDSEALAERLIASGAKRAEIEGQLKLIQSDAAQVREQEIAVVNEQAEAAERYIQALMSETAMIGMSYAAAAKLQARLQAEEKMRDEIAKAMKAGRVYTQEQIQAKIKEAGATAAANVELERYVNWLREIGKTDAEVSFAVDGIEGGNIADPIWDAVKASETLQDRLRDAFAPDGIGVLKADVAALGALLEKLSEDDESYAAVRKAYLQAGNELWSAQIAKISEGVSGAMAFTQALGSLFEEGSKGQKRAEQATAALAVVQAGLATVDAVRAVLTAAQAPWPLNFGSMAAMAAAVAPLLSAVGAALPAFSSGGGGGSNSAAYRQERQGTGTVLGDETAKSESILNAVEITANATEQLVGINRGMLNALNAMQAGISGASTLLARGAGNGVDTSLGRGIGSALSGIPVIGSLLGGALSNIFGGKESLRDQGIRIVGGTLNSMIDDIMVQSYASIHRSGGWFRSSRDYDRFADIGDDVSRQFSMVLSSMADAVRAAADALGLDMDEINARIASFRIEEIRISTMDLSAEEAQKELEASFSAIFDGLAGHVVPFIAQFQKVGEGLAETLIRVATGVQVTQEAMIQLGFALDETDPERFAQVSEALIELAGGIDEFISRMSSFVNNFAPESHKFAVAQDALTRAFAEYGIEIPATREAMWDLMQAQDATTESGRAVIAMLLRLSGVSDSYYDALEDRAAAMERIDADIAAGAWEQYLDGLEEGQRAIVELTRYYDDWIASATAAGATAEQLTAIEEQRTVAMGRLLAAAEAQYQQTAQGIADQYAAASGASDYQQSLVRIDREYQSNVQALNAAARAAGRAGAAERDLARALGIATKARAAALAALQAEAQELANTLYGTPLTRLDAQIEALQSAESAASSAVSGFGGAMTEAANAASDAINLLLGDMSPLRAVDKLPLALEALAKGETDANTVLSIARDVYGSGRAYNEVFEQVMAMAGTARTSGGGGGGPVEGSGLSGGVSPQLQALLDQREKLLKDEEQSRRFMQASQLAGMVAQLSTARGEGFDAIAESLGFGLEQFAKDLNFGSVDALTEYLTTLQEDQAGIADLYITPTAGDLLIVQAIESLKPAETGGWGDESVVPVDGAVLYPDEVAPVDGEASYPEAARVVELSEAHAETSAEQLAMMQRVSELLAELLAELRARADAVESTADATASTVAVLQEVAGAIDRLGQDGPADAANMRRGG